jgi:8-oxo-dGTP diphosphatase
MAVNKLVSNLNKSSTSSIPLKDKEKIEVVAAVIRHNEKILCVQRGENTHSYISRKYEFPGGKIEEGESRQQALIREIQEELHMEISPKTAFVTVEHEYPDFLLTMHSFICHCNDPTVTLTEHIDYRWLLMSELDSLDWASADIPIVNQLIHL